MSNKISFNYSPNFNYKKRKPKEIKFIIFHYTGMRNEVKSINLLTSQKSKVSSNYFIKKNGEILTLVPDLFVAWHAGISSWQTYKSINKYSLGIEISNPGHDHKYKNFSKNQLTSLKKLLNILIKKYNINKKNVLGHSDIAPTRKKDPGEKFPWKELAKKRLCLWHNLKVKELKKFRNKKINSIEKKIFFTNISKIGYDINNLDKEKKYIISAFQRRFRPELINTYIDEESYLISKNLI